MRGNTAGCGHWCEVFSHICMCVREGLDKKTMTYSMIPGAVRGNTEAPPA